MRLFAFIASLVAVLVVLVAFSSSSSSAQSEPQNTPKPEVKQTQNPEVVEMVKKGDTLTKIATKHKTTYPKLYDANLFIVDPDLIYPGDKVRIPAADEKLKNRKIPSNSELSTWRTKPSSAFKAKPSATLSSGNVWDRLAQCESGGNWGTSTGNGYYGGLQFTMSSWLGVGGSGYPHQASREEQIARAEVLLSSSGWGAWPACAAKLGLL